jgi:HlyD family secretion protein
MTRRNWIYTAIGAAALALLLSWAFAPRPVAVETAAVALGRFETTIDEEGKTRLTERYVVTAPLAGQLARITLKEGDPVAKGAAVATLTPVLPTLLDERSRRELQAREQTAEAGLQRAGTRIARAQVALEQTQIELKRAEQLSQQGFVAATKLDADRLAVRSAPLGRPLPAVGVPALSCVHRWPGRCCGCCRPAKARWPWARRCWSWVTRRSWRWWPNC